MAEKIFKSIKIYKTYQHTIRLLSVRAKIEKKDKKIKSEYKISDDILNHYKSVPKRNAIQLFPEQLLRKKHKAPDSYYLADPAGVKIISNHLLKDIGEACSTFVVANPGPGFITGELLDGCNKKIVLLEPNSHFLENLEEFHYKYPERIKVRHGDFPNFYKLVFQDKLDNGTRLSDLLVDVPKSDYNDGDIKTRLFAGIGTLNFFKHLITSIIFPNSLLSYGRFEMYLVMPPPLFIHLTCSRDAGYMIYRATTLLFQILFEHKFITKLPRTHFLPWQFEPNIAKQTKLTKYNSIHAGSLYLVKIIPRRNLYKLCPQEDLQALWYFIKQNCVSRKYRVIPTLEKWIPGCGPRLISNSVKPVPIEKLDPSENVKQLPPYTMPCIKMSNQDFFPNLNIFTEFGDLTPSQMLTLFTQFRSWPEYKESPFLPSLESSLIKMEGSDESLEIETLYIDDDKAK